MRRTETAGLKKAFASAISQAGAYIRLGTISRGSCTFPEDVQAGESDRVRRFAARRGKQRIGVSQGNQEQCFKVQGDRRPVWWMEDHVPAVEQQGRGGRSADRSGLKVRGDISSSDGLESLLKDGRLHEALAECIKNRNLAVGRRVYALAVNQGLDKDVSIGKRFIRLFASARCLSEARQAFRNIVAPNASAWRLIISAEASLGTGEEAVKLYQEMVWSGVRPNEYIFVPALKACASLGLLREGREIHSQVIKSGCKIDVYLGTALVDMYAKCGSLADGRKVFNCLTEKNVALWTSIIAGYAQGGRGQEALQLFEQMQMQGVQPNRVTFVCVLKACTSVAALEQGREIHAQVLQNGFECDMVLGNALVDMYCKCGSLDEALRLFDQLPGKDVVSWTSLIGGYAHNGDAEGALNLFEQMQAKGLEPNGITFVNVLTACNHAGRVEEGSRLFQGMSKSFGISPQAEHYASMVDLLGRAGHLNEVEEFINAMPLQADVKVWTSVLGACHTHGNLELGKRAFREVIEREPGCASAYVLMSNIYEAADRMDDAIAMRRMMRTAGVTKLPGRSWIQVQNEVFSFQALCVPP